VNIFKMSIYWWIYYQSFTFFSFFFPLFVFTSHSVLVDLHKCMHWQFLSKAWAWFFPSASAEKLSNFREFSWTSSPGGSKKAKVWESLPEGRWHPSAVVGLTHCHISHKLTRAPEDCFTTCQSLSWHILFFVKGEKCNNNTSHMKWSIRSEWVM